MVGSMIETRMPRSNQKPFKRPHLCHGPKLINPRDRLKRFPRFVRATTAKTLKKALEVKDKCLGWIINLLMQVRSIP